MVAGIIANMLAVNPDLSLADIKAYLHSGADQIGPEADQAPDPSNEFSYDPASGFNKYYGHGRANSYKSTYLCRLLQLTAGHEYSQDTMLCPPTRTHPKPAKTPTPARQMMAFWLLMLPAILSGAKNN